MNAKLEKYCYSERLEEDGPNSSRASTMRCIKKRRQKEITSNRYREVTNKLEEATVCITNAMHTLRNVYLHFR